MALTRPMRNYTRRLLAMMTLYAAALVGAIEWFQSGSPPTGWLAPVVAALPALPIVGVFWVIAQLIVETADEYQRLLFVKQTLIATGLTLSVATVWGFLENFGQVPHIPGFHVAGLWLAMWGVGAIIARWRA